MRPGQPPPPPRPVVVYNTRFARTDWWMFALYALAAAVACLALGASMWRDERLAFRARAEHVARTFATQLAAAAATPGSDFAGTLPQLAATAGPHVRLEVIEERAGGTFTFARKARYLGHSDPARAGGELDAQRPQDREVFELVERAHQRQSEGAPSVVEWTDGKVSAAALGPEESAVAAVVEGLEPHPPTGRPLRMALVAFALLLLFAAGLHDVLPKVGPYLNFLVLAGGVFVLGLLGDALQPSLWRGNPTDVLVRRAEGLKLADLARALTQDLPPAPSAVLEYGAPIAGLAVVFYLLALVGLWHRAARSVRLHARAYRYAAPAALVFGVVAVVPVSVGIGLAFWRATPSERFFLGFANFAAFFDPVSLASPVSLWRPLLVTIAFACCVLLGQLLVGVGAALVLASRRLVGRTAYRLLLSVPWALPLWVSALLWSRLWRGGAAAQLFGAGGEWMADPGRAFVANVVAGVWTGFPVVLVVALAALERLPKELFEAARLEGLSTLQRTRLLALPLLRPALAPAVAILFALSLSAFLLVSQVSAGGPEGQTDLLVTRAFRWAFERYEFGYAAAWTLVGCVLLGAWLLLVRRLEASVRPAPAPVDPTFAQVEAVR